METVYFGFVVFLFVLAIFDLMVGVSNDAVNFLQSAIGAKVAKFKTILTIAAIGIFTGAAMSNGMMEVARNGVFYPSFFSFQDVMFIFLAVMASDIVLLDIFNTLGMPTSTTVSMVFELLGGTFALALMKVAGDPSLHVADLMNTSKALTMIMAIFVSVAIAFVVGAFVQYISRTLFTFVYKNNSLKWKIGIFGGLAFTAIIYFMLIKGLGNVSFISDAAHEWINTHSWTICGICFVVTAVLSQVLFALKVNVFKILVLTGTFALAMAFAGNDLVNFIGVPLAGYSSFQDYSANAGGDAASYMMDSLNGPAHTPVLFLIAAGLIMVISLATSKKAFNVVKTSVDLARQDAGDEMFGSSKMARVLVRFSTNTASALSELVPNGVKRWFAKRFDNENVVLPQGAAFDEIRATVNLVVSSLLIALGTSLTLPLSTTYVTFMVAMGSSLADKAWGRESAVFRITGVISVIGGWFITAGAAFILCFLVALAMSLGGLTMASILIALSIVLLVRSNIKYKKKQAEEKGDVVFNQMITSEDNVETLRLLTQHIRQGQSQFLDFVNVNYLNVTEGFISEDLSRLQKAESAMRKQRQELKQRRRKEMLGLRRIDPGVAIEKSTWFHLGVNSCEDMLYSLRRICDPCEEHIDNSFVPLEKDRIKEFLPLRDTLLYLLKRAVVVISTENYTDSDKLREQCEEFKSCLSSTRQGQIERMQTSKENITVSYVYLNLLQETHEIASSLQHLLRASKHFAKE
ncbi:MAG: inorganic phosphate transporter [Bacteroidales bacterium]|nr:inorganic phosphate transporter [Bacteroidales bacterium]